MEEGGRVTLVAKAESNAEAIIEEQLPKSTPETLCVTGLRSVHKFNLDFKKIKDED